MNILELGLSKLTYWFFKIYCLFYEIKESEYVYGEFMPSKYTDIKDLDNLCIFVQFVDCGEEHLNNLHRYNSMNSDQILKEIELLRNKNKLNTIGWVLKDND